MIRLFASFVDTDRIRYRIRTMVLVYLISLFRWCVCGVIFLYCCFLYSMVDGYRIVRFLMPIRDATTRN